MIVAEKYGYAGPFDEKLLFDMGNVYRRSLLVEGLNLKTPRDDFKELFFKHYPEILKDIASAHVNRIESYLKGFFKDRKKPVPLWGKKKERDENIIESPSGQKIRMTGFKPNA